MTGPRIEVTAIHFTAFGFPDFEELKKRGWKVPGDDPEIVKDSLIRTIDEQLIMLIKRGKEITAAIRPVSIDPEARGIGETEVLAMIAGIFETLE